MLRMLTIDLQSYLHRSLARKGPPFRPIEHGHQTMPCATAQDIQIAVDQKNLLRRKVRDDLKLMTEEDQQNESAGALPQAPGPSNDQPLKRFCLPPGALIAESVLASDYFRCAKRAGVYLHCPRLREVDTSRLIREAMLQGDSSPARGDMPSKHALAMVS